MPITKKKKKPIKATIKQAKAIKIASENGGNISKAMREAGYTDITAATPKKLTESKAWKEIMGEALPDEELAKHHKALLNAKSLDHMVFPLEGTDKETKALKKAQSKLTDDDIIDMLAAEGCIVRRIVHGEQARHVYFWTNDNNSRKSALDMAYKLKGNYAAEKSIAITIPIDPEKKQKSNELIERILRNKQNS